jgi:hydroxymethylpyrimidine/phosphomethylpyrimidine kinase
MLQRRWSKRRVVISGFVVIRRFFRFEGAGGAKWSTSASACVIPTMRTSMTARGKAVSSAVSSGRHEITKGMRKTRSIGQDIEWWWKVSEVHIPDTKNALYRAFLDSLS